MEEFEVSIVMPCLNEEKSVGICVSKALKVLRENKIKGEVVVADNGSTDNSVKIAAKAGARVVFQHEKGYGNAYKKGFSEAKGKYIISADSDNTYDFLEAPKFLAELRKGYDFVIGTRLKGNIHRGAMPWLHRYIGNPLLSGVLNILFHTKISDSHCGMRGFTREVYKKLNMKTTGMEFTSELIVNASLNKLKMKEIPVNYYPREGEAKLRSFSDGWRHFRFMLLYSPNIVFIIPGLIIFILGMLIEITLISTHIKIGRAALGPVTMLLGALLSIIGYQIIIFGIFAKDFMVQNKFLKESRFMNDIMKRITLEKGIIAGILLILPSILINLIIVLKWIRIDFKDLSFDDIETAIFAITLFIFGVQTIFSSFLMSVLKIKINN